MASKTNEQIIEIKPVEIVTTVVRIVGDEDLTARMLENALNELEAFRHKYNTLAQLASVFSAIDAVKEEMHDDETV